MTPWPHVASQGRTSAAGLLQGPARRRRAPGGGAARPVNYFAEALEALRLDLDPDLLALGQEHGRPVELDRDIEAVVFMHPRVAALRAGDRAPVALRGRSPGRWSQGAGPRPRKRNPAEGAAACSSSTTSRASTTWCFAARRRRAARDRGSRSRRVRLLGLCRWGRAPPDPASSRASSCSPAPSSSGRAAEAEDRLHHRPRRSWRPTTCRPAACRRRRTWSAATTSRSRPGARWDKNQVPAGTDLVVMAGPQVGLPRARAPDP